MMFRQVLMSLRVSNGYDKDLLLNKFCDYKKELPDSKKIELAEIIIEIKKCKGRLEEIDGYRDLQFGFMDHWWGN